MNTTDIQKLIINQLTEEQYQAAKTAGTLNPNELYFTESDDESGAKIATGSYVGTGTYGSGNKNSLALSFPAKYVVVLGKAFSGYASAYSAFINVEQGAGLHFSAGSAANSNGITAQNSGNTVQWYAQGAPQQMNTNGTTYIYVAIG